MTKPIADRDKFTIALLGHPAKTKGMQDALDAIALCREHYPQLQVHIFTTYQLNFTPLPWVHVYFNPSSTKLNALYNRCALFVAPSWTEGFGLTPAEAMQCGCAVVATAIGGHSEFCVDNQTALLVPIQNPKAQACAILRLLNDDCLRLRIAKNGNRAIQQFDFARSANALASLINRTISQNNPP